LRQSHDLEDALVRQTANRECCADGKLIHFHNQIDDNFSIKRLLGRSIMALVTSSTGMSLDYLNDDVLLIICFFVSKLSGMVLDDEIPNGSTASRPDISAIRSLSMVNKHFRELTASWIFRHPVITQPDLQKASKALDVVERCPAMWKYGR
jgi:hypothetical protein